MNLTPTQEAKLVRMQTALKMRELYAMKWIAMATTGTATRRNITRAGKRLMPDELVEEALNTASDHIHSMETITNDIALLLEGKEDKIID